jgi:hypothetical protein
MAVLMESFNQRDYEETAPIHTIKDSLLKFDETSDNDYSLLVSNDSIENSFFDICIQPNASSSLLATDSEKIYLPLFEFVVSLMLLVIVALPGLVGNFISIFILSRPQMKTSLNVILIGNVKQLSKNLKQC